MSNEEHIHKKSLKGLREVPQEFEVLESEFVYPGKFFSVERKALRLPGGAEVDHEHLVYADAVTIIPVIETEAGREVLMIEQFRTALEGFIYELPAGMVDPGEDALKTAKRELEEETGYRAQNWTHVTTLYSTPGISSAKMTYFLAEGLTNDGEQALEPGECLTLKRVPLKPLIESMVEGKSHEAIPAIVDSKAHVGIYYLAARAYGG